VFECAVITLLQGGLMAKNDKVKSADFAKGGSTKMFGPQGAEPQVAGQTAQPNGGDGGKFAKGGSGKMFGYCGAEAAKPGITGAR